MENINSLEELYNKLEPVLKTKVNEMKLRNINYINEVDIWNCLSFKWSKKINLTFSDMVSDILNTNNNVFEEYIKEKREESHGRIWLYFTKMQRKQL